MESINELQRVKKSLSKINEQTILVTGGTGTFGNALVSILLELNYQGKIILFSRDEYKQHVMEMKFPHKKYPQLRFFIGDVRDQERLQMAFHGVDIVIHAAALKHVPIAEYNPFECIKTNVIGAENIVNAAINAGVKKVLALSTDKAAAPINLYGVSKLAADKIFCAANHLGAPRNTYFSCIRYGNVMGSRGSVIKVFKKLLDDGVKELPITDARMTRFFITIQQAIYFVLTSLHLMRGGEIFVPKIPSVKIVDIAKAMNNNNSYCICGIRPGEKLHEEMITVGDALSTVDYEDRYIIEPNHHQWKRKSFIDDNATPVEDSFRYSSENNDDWITGEQLQKMINDALLSEI